MKYRHRQMGTWTLVIGAASILLLVLLLLFVEANPIGIAVLCILVVCFTLFATLTVEVGDRDILLTFGPGLVQKRFALGAIKAARAVRNRWYYGFGIHGFWNGWLYNVSGLDAVEIEMTNGHRNRIGTDEPAKLLEAIEAARRAELPDFSKGR